MTAPLDWSEIGFAFRFALYLTYIREGKDWTFRKGRIALRWSRCLPETTEGSWTGDLIPRQLN